MTIYEKIDRCHEAISEIHPFEGHMLEQLKDYYRIGLTWSSNAIEGNALTISETKVVLEDGLTIGGRPLRDFYETVGHGEAYDFMFTLIGERRITVEDIKAERDNYHPVTFAALLHLKFVSIHPFIDGNGRTSRLIMNLALIQDGCQLAIIPPVLRTEYNDAIRQYQNKGKLDPFCDFIAEQVYETQKEIMRLLHIPFPELSIG